MTSKSDQEAKFRPVFFVRLMKTGSTTLEHYIRSNIPATRLFPWSLPPFDFSRFSTKHIRNLSDQDRASIQAYSGHYPASAASLVGRPVFTMTVLRDPVERAISHLKMVRRENPPSVSYEEIYCHSAPLRRLLCNHQLRVFGLPESADSITDALDLTEDVFDAAVARLKSFNFIGLQHRHEDFSRAVGQYMNWRSPPTERLNVTPVVENPIPEDVRRQIEIDNELDRRFYLIALDLCGPSGYRVSLSE